jgi:aspartate dehydrogenase
MARERIALIGFGAIGRAVADGLTREADGCELVAVLVRAAQIEGAKAALPASAAVTTTAGGLLAKRPSLVVECAGQGAVAEHGEVILASGCDLMLVSTGALAAPGLLERLEEAAAASGARLIIPAGAIAGLDGLGALKRAGLTRVTYTSAKPPLAWRGTPAERLMDLGGLAERTVFFEGTAREAALAYPKNANLAATVALGGLGFDETRVRLVADPRAAGNTGMVEAESEAGTLKLEMAGRASANPKTSASVAFSVLHAIAARTATLVI